MQDPLTIGLRGVNGRIFTTVPILRPITLRGIPGFCIHKYMNEDHSIEYRVSFVETGAYLCAGATDGEAFVQARKFDKAELERLVAKTRYTIKQLEETGKL